MTLFTRDDLEMACRLVYDWMPQTPTYQWPVLNRETGLSLHVKHENHTPTGAFKVRGGLVFCHQIKKTLPDIAGLISATRGNHGQSLAFAGARHNLPVTIVVPEGNSQEKNAAMQALGADLIVHGKDFDEARFHAMALAEEQGLTPVPPFHRDLVMGVATYAFEFFRQAGHLDRIYAPIGMGSGICGLITVRDLLGLSTEIIGVVSEGAPAYARSFASGTCCTTETARTYADGMACRMPDENAFAIIQRGAADVITVSDTAIAEATRTLFRATHNIAEGAGAAALAGACSQQNQPYDTQVGVVLSGSNLDTEQFAAILSGQHPNF